MNRFVERLGAFIRQIFRQRELMLLWIIGLLLLVGVDTLLVQDFNRRQEFRNTLLTQKVQTQIQTAIDEHVTALIALQVVYQNFVDINAYDFQLYGRSITSNLKGFNRLFFIGPDLQIRQVYPYSPETEGLYGSSISDQPAVVDALQRARQTRSPATTGLVKFFADTHSMLAVAPVSRNRQEFLGYAVADISLEKLWLNYVPKDPLESYQMQVLDPNRIRVFEGVDINRGNRDVVAQPFRIGDLEWTLLVNPIGNYGQNLIVERLSLWLGGILILSLLQLLIQGSRQHKNEMEQAQKQFETIFEASPDGIMLLDDQLNVRLTNPQIRQWAGHSEDELTSRKFFDLFECQCPNLDKCKELEFLLCTSSRFDDTLPEILETRLLDDSATPMTFRLNASQVEQDFEGKPQKGFICVLGDISTAKELERTKETYVATLSHDLKTPLLAQQMVLDSLLSESPGPVNGDQRKLLEGAKESVGDLVEMVNANLLFYRLEGSHVQLHKQKIPIQGILRETLDTLQPLAEKRQLSLELDVPMELPDAWVDAIQIKRVFHNLVSNAIHYGRRNSTVYVRVFRETEQVEDMALERLLFEVKNEGKGIAPADVPRIFSKYYSLSRKFNKIGTGLGLYIARRIVELHGGKIWVESEPDKETRFFVSLPCPTQVQGTAVAPV